MKHNRRSFRLLCLAGLIFSGTAHAIGPSFDCAKAQSVVEKAICADPSLAESDSNMARLHKQLVESHEGDDLAGIRNQQQEWLKERNECAEDIPSAVVECLRRSYSIQISILEARLSPFGGPALRQWDKDVAGLCTRQFSMSKNDSLNRIDLGYVEVAENSGWALATIHYNACGGNAHLVSTYIVGLGRAKAVDIPGLHDMSFIPESASWSGPSEIVFKGYGWYGGTEDEKGIHLVPSPLVSAFPKDYSDPHCCPSLVQSLRFDVRQQKSTIYTDGLTESGVETANRLRAEAAARRAPTPSPRRQGGNAASSKAAPPIPPEIDANCREIAAAGGTFSYSVLNYCIDREMKERSRYLSR